MIRKYATTIIATLSITLILGVSLALGTASANHVPGGYYYFYYTGIPCWGGYGDGSIQQIRWTDGHSNGYGIWEYCF